MTDVVESSIERVQPGGGVIGEHRHRGLTLNEQVVKRHAQVSETTSDYTPRADSAGPHDRADRVGQHVE